MLEEFEAHLRRSNLAETLFHLICSRYECINNYQVKSQSKAYWRSKDT